MNIIKKIKTLLKEAELYHSQGLLYEAIAKYNDTTELIQNNEQLKNKQLHILRVKNEQLAA